MTYSFFAVLIFTCSVAGATAINAPRQGPTLTTSVEGLYPPPTSTDSAVLDGYQDALRKCGPDVDAATQSALQQYNVEIIGQVPGTKNVTDANDSKFIAWTVTHSDLNQVKLLCETARRAFENLPFTRELSTSPSATSGQISSSQSSTVAHQDDPSIPPGTTTPSTSTAVTATTSHSSSRKGVAHSLQTIVLLTAGVTLLACWISR